MRFVLNDRSVETDDPPGMPALDFLRRKAGLTGVKYACREGDCGSCAVLVGRRARNDVRYQVVTSCLMPLGALADCHVVTIEGLNRTHLTPIQQAFVDSGASQCGFCTPGFIVSLAGHFLEARRWNTADAVEAVAGNICRCTGYASIVRSIENLLDILEDRVDVDEPRRAALVREKFLPDSFLFVAELLPESVPDEPGPPSPSQIIVSGGTDLYVQQPNQVADGPVYIVPGPITPAIRRDDSFVYLAATATAEDMKQSEVLAATVGGVDRAMELMGSLPIRNRATIAGNLVNASPIGDMTITLLALGAEVGLVSPGSDHRVVPLDAFYLGYKSLDLNPAEMVEWVRFPAVEDGLLFNFEKVSKRTYLDIATVNTAISLRVAGGRMSNVRVSAGGVGPVPMQLRMTMAALEGSAPDIESALAAAETARSEISPITDVRGSAEYKRLLLGQLVLAHFEVLFGVEVGVPVEATP